MQTILSLRTQIKICPEQVMASQLLRAAGADLEERVGRELADNPALELASEGASPDDPQRGSTLSLPDIPAGNTTASSGRSGSIAAGSGRDFSPSGTFQSELAEQVAARPSAIDQLMAQAALMAAGADLEAAIFLLQSLDGHGYLRARPEALAAELGVSTASIERARRVLHQLEPPGIGARDARECFLVQCAHLESEGVDCRVVCRILSEAWDDFAGQRWGRVAQKLRLPASAVEEAWHFIYQNLYPYPLLMVEDAPAGAETFRQADLIIHREIHGGQSTYTLEIPAAEALALRLSACFERAWRDRAGDKSELSPTEQAWIQTHLERARLFMAALNQRWSTLRRIGEYLIDYQFEFLERGPRRLKPLTRAGVAGALDLHESTVSRAISEKTVQLPGGRLMPLSDFFDDSLAAKEAIRQLLARARKPLSDREIAERLRGEGLPLARRTVAKYRQQLNIPPKYGQPA